MVVLKHGNQHSVIGIKHTTQKNIYANQETMLALIDDRVFVLLSMCYILGTTLYMYHIIQLREVT